MKTQNSSPTSSKLHRKLLSIPLCRQSACLATSVYMWPVLACSQPWYPQFLAVSTQLVQTLTPQKKTSVIPLSQPFYSPFKIPLSSNLNPKPNNSMSKTSGQAHHIPILHTHHLQLHSSPNPADNSGLIPQSLVYHPSPYPSHIHLEVISARPARIRSPTVSFVRKSCDGAE